MLYFSQYPESTQMYCVGQGPVIWYRNKEKRTTYFKMYKCTGVCKIQYCLVTDE